MIMFRNLTSIFCGLTLAAAAGLSGCSSSDKAQPTASSPPSVGAQSPGKGPQSQAGTNSRPGQNGSSLDALRRGEVPRSGGDLKEVLFDFDRYDLDSEDRRILQTNAAWLKNNPTARIEIEGHCDERGTNEYNLALGAKRAQASKDYLLSLGVAPNRISTTSFGAEIPICKEHNEDCWQKNRRDRFVNVAGKPGA
jgi:peptidoglycan-associated lipoprotein